MHAHEAPRRTACFVSLSHTHTSKPSPFLSYLLPPPPPCRPHAPTQGDYDRRPNSFLVYAPSRTCAVYGPAEWADADADRKPAGVPGLGVKELGPYYEY